jgi:predicted MFS family arabinose efflux permease
MLPNESAKGGLYLVLLFGAVNLFADMTYEGARSVTGPFLGTLGASGFVVGAVTGFGTAGQITRQAEATPARRYPPPFWWYLAGASLVGFGFADYSLIAYHFSKGHTVSPIWVPIFYALAMGAGGLGSLIFGKLFDRVGLILLVPITVVIAAYAPLAFLGGFGFALFGALLWGIGLGAHESVMQAAVAQIIPHERLGSAYGLFGGVFGVAWFAGSAAIGDLYDVSVGAAVLLAVVAQLLAVAPLLIAARMSTDIAA